jgi:sigma-E factor negative regulatory protein RseA
MTQETSSLMDGELSPAEAARAIRACCDSPGDIDNWHLYHVIGDAMRGQVPRELAYNRAIRAALEQEPAIVARPKRVLDTAFARVSLAAAASVATIGIVGWMGFQQGGSSAPAAVAAGVPSSGIMPAGASKPAPAMVVDTRPYEAAHRQVPRPDAYTTVANKAPAPAK